MKKRRKDQRSTPLPFIVILVIIGVFIIAQAFTCSIHTVTTKNSDTRQSISVNPRIGSGLNYTYRHALKSAPQAKIVINRGGDISSSRRSSSDKARIAAAQSSAWIAPASANSLHNPVKGKASATALGKIKYDQLCSICHGPKGKGDGMAGISLDPRPANFNSSKIQSQTDGAIFWKLTQGRAPMAGYKMILTEQERWQLVNYIRTFKK